MTALKKVVRPIPKSGPDTPPALRIMDTISPSINGAVNDRYVVINRDKIDPNPHQPRKNFDKKALKELSESMYKFGQIQAITVRPHPTRAGRYQLISGERRLLASKPYAGFNGLPQLKALVREAKDNEMADLAFTENIQREELTPAETVAVVERFSKNGYSQIQIEDHFKKYRNWAYKHLKAAKAGDDIKWLLDYPETIDTVILVDKIEDVRLRYQVINFIKGRIDKGCSTREVKDFIASKQVPKAQPRETAPSWGIKAAPEPEATPRPDTSTTATSDNNGITTSRHIPAQPEKIVETTLFGEPRNGPLIASADVPRHFNAPKLEPETVGNLPDKCLEGLTTFIAEFQAMDARGDWAIERKIEWRDTLERIMASAQFARDMIEI